MAASEHLPHSVGPQSPTCLSVISLSDSEPDSCDLDPNPIFQPDEDHLLYHHHHFDQVSVINKNSSCSSQNAFVTGSNTIGLGLGLGLDDPNCAYPGEGKMVDNTGSYCNCDYSNNEVDLELGLGLGLGFRDVLDNETRCFEGGLRVVNINDSDSDETDDDENDHGGFGGVSDFDRPPYCWDYLGFNNGSRVERDEVEVGVREPDVGSVVNDTFEGFYDEHYYHGVEEEGEEEGEGVGSPIQLDTDVSNVFDTYQMRAEQQEIAIDSETDEGGGVDDAIRDLEWEILLAVNNFNREVDDMDFNMDMYEAILNEVEDGMNEWRGSPPAAEVVIENLASVRVPCFEDDEVVCAICRDEVAGEEVLKQLPCSHYYHGECIVPWLRIRNTCPVCRHELPTDDAEYEYQKRERERAREMEEQLNVDVNEDVSEESLVRYDFHVFF